MARRIKNLFVSYSRDDKHWTYELAQALRDELDLTAFVDYRSIHVGVDWWQTICENLEGCDCVIYVMTPRSIESIYCRAEIGYALALNKPILPVMLKPCAFPDELSARRVQYLTVTDALTIPQVLLKLQSGLLEIQGLIYEGVYNPPNPPPPRPPEPKPHDRRSADEVFDLAAEAAETGQLEAAETLFAQVAAADGGGRLGKRAQARLEELRSYQQVARRAAKPATQRDARALWGDHCAQFGDEFDPLGLAGKLAEKPPEAPPPADSPRPGSQTRSGEAPEMRAALERARRFSGRRNRDWQPFIATFPDLPIPDLPFCLVPAGAFRMGSDEYSDEYDEKPVHDQRIEQPFWISQHPVTNDQWRRAVAAGAVEEPRGAGALEWYRDPKMGQAPVVGVNWFMARDFAAWLGCRLPTEREWEYAARGVESWRYPWGDDWDPDKAVWKENSGGRPAAVTSKPEGASWVGALHLSGNVWKWTSSLYQPYPYREGDGREADTGSRTDVQRVLRGGSFNYSTNNLRAADRSWSIPDLDGSSLGFCCARSLE